MFYRSNLGDDVMIFSKVSPTCTPPSSGIVLADTKGVESVSADRQLPDQKASRCRVRLATGVPDPMHSNSRRLHPWCADWWERRPPNGLLPDSESRW